MDKMIGFLGAEDSGKETLHEALIEHAIANDHPVVLNCHYPHEVSDDIIRKVIRSGGMIDLGCDPCMTREGKAIEERIRQITSHLGFKPSWSKIKDGGLA